MIVPFVNLSPIHKPITKKLTAVFEERCKAGDFILGSYVDDFEKKFAAHEGCVYGIGVANGTDAIMLALKAAGIMPGDEVITQAHTFISSALAITYTGATPVFADISEHFYTLDPLSAEKKITKKTKALLPVSLYGQPPDISGLAKLAKTYKLKLILDNAQAHGATYKKKPLGSFGLASTYSFYPAKNLGAFGDAGMVTTNNVGIDKKVRLLRNIGRDGWYSHPTKGYNSRLDTLQAAILSEKLTFLDEWTKKRQGLAKNYDRLLKNLPIILPKVMPYATHVYHLYVIRTQKREEFMKYLLDHGIHTAIHYPIPVHKQKAYKEANRERLPISEKVSKQVVSLPFYVGLSNEMQEYVAQKITDFFSRQK